MKVASYSRCPVREPSNLKHPASSLQNSNRHTPKKLEFSLTRTKHALDSVSNRHTYACFVISNRYSFAFLPSGCFSLFPSSCACPDSFVEALIRARLSAIRAQLLEILVTRPESTASSFLIVNFCALFGLVATPFTLRPHFRRAESIGPSPLTNRPFPVKNERFRWVLHSSLYGSP